MSKKYAIGLDYGTQSGRAVLVDLHDGTEIAEHVTPYRHHVIDERLPISGTKLEHDWALQHPADYIEVLEQSIPAVVQQSGVEPSDIIGIGIDFTACTILPIDADGTPLCVQTQYRDNPHSWVKLWKHHAAQEEADQITSQALSSGEKWLPRYGGTISCEWMHAKIWQVLDEAPEIFEASDQFVEAVDWVISQMTGTLKRGSCTAGYKALWHKQDGYPSNEFLESLDARLANLHDTKLRGEVLSLGSKAGELTAAMAERIGLEAGTAVAVGIIDAHAGMPGVGVVTPGKLVMAMGTSICHLLLADEEKHVEGVGGVVEDGIIPGYYAYEAGQAAVGDIFEWYVEEAVPAYIHKDAEAAGESVHQYLTRKASELSPGQSGLLALDWWNGNRSVLVDPSLTGTIVGLNLLTKPWEIYRTLFEATAFGTRKIIEAFEQNGFVIDELYACGGLPQKNALLMQIYADVTNKEIKIADSKQTNALGAAMYGAVAAGAAKGGYDSLVDAAAAMGRVRKDTYKPDPQRAAVYNQLYVEYLQLHDYFGRGGNDVMKRLRAIKEGQAAN